MHIASHGSESTTHRYARRALFELLLAACNATLKSRSYVKVARSYTVTIKIEEYPSSRSLRESSISVQHTYCAYVQLSKEPPQVWEE